jgi:glucose/arabinose dehydrogenase
MSIEAIVKDGVIRPLEPLPADWQEGHTVTVSDSALPDWLEVDPGLVAALEEADANYGWPVITYGINYNGSTITELREMEGMEQPVHYWVPSIATSGIAIYSGDRFPNWRGDVFVGGLAGQHLARVRFDADKRKVEDEKLLEGIGRVRDVRVGPDGLIYLLIDSADAPLVRIEPVDD